MNKCISMIILSIGLINSIEGSAYIVPTKPWESGKYQMPDQISVAFRLARYIKDETGRYPQREEQAKKIIAEIADKKLSKQDIYDIACYHLYGGSKNDCCMRDCLDVAEDLILYSQRNLKDCSSGCLIQ